MSAASRPRSSISRAWRKNLKDLGDGKVWIIGTAQQTLTEDDPRAAINSPELYKLKDRFPITVDLESSDIKEICYRRLLGKSSAGERELGAAVRPPRPGAAPQHQAARTPNTTTPSFDRETFTNLYPFLPAHFDILLHLLGALAKSTGGIGLRSAIKVIQDILVEGAGTLTARGRPRGGVARDDGHALRRAGQGHPPRLPLGPSGGRQGAHPLPRRRAVPGRRQDRRRPSDPRQHAGHGAERRRLMHPAVDGASHGRAVKQAVERLLKDPIVPLGEKDGSLRFFSEKLNDVEQERAGLVPRTPDLHARLQRSAHGRLRSAAQRSPPRHAVR